MKEGGRGGRGEGEGSEKTTLKKASLITVNLEG